MASFALPIIGMGAQILGGIFGNSAAKKAAKVQADANTAAAQNVERATQVQSPLVTAAAARSGDRTMDAAYTGATGVDQSAKNANLLLDPFRDTGVKATNQLTAGLDPGSEFNRSYTAADLPMDPGYQFRLQQGQQALERSAAARGGATGGGALKDLTTFSQGTASQEFQKAFDRFRTERQDRFNNLNTLAGRGTDVSATQGQNLIGGSEFGSNLIQGASQYAGNADMTAAQINAQNEIESAKAAGNFRVGAGEATASGIVGGHNAIAAGIGGAVNTGMSGLLLNKLKNPAAMYGPPSPAYGQPGGWLGTV